MSTSVPTALEQTLDDTTREVREFYERYPYPAHAAPTLRTGFDLRYVTSLGALAPPSDRPLRVLDAGCGRGVGLIAGAAANPHASFVGVDLNRVALEEARGNARARGLENVTLAEVDLMTLEGLEVPEGGFDVIHSSGVLHHLSDPAAGLLRLREVLAPHGVISLMVYGALGRAEIARVARAIDAALDPELELEQRLVRARDLARTLADTRSPDCPFAEAARVPDSEFVDRYLHPNEVAYDVPALFELIDGAGLRRLAWADPTAWSVQRWVPAGAERLRAAALPERARYALVEQLARPASHELYLGHAENEPRPAPADDAWESELFACHPEVQFEVRTRNLWRGQRVETVAYVLRDGERVELPGGPLAQAAFLLANQSEPFYGRTLFSELHDRGMTQEAATSLLRDLLFRELVYRPHASELLRR